MRIAILFALTLTMDANAEPPASPDRAAYERALESAGRDSTSQVNLALWCEAHGMSAERMKHLARAVLIDPKNATARGLMGLVEYKGRWNRPESVADKVKADVNLGAKLAEYNARRASAKETADSQAALALWCERNGLEAEAKAHYSAVVRLDPKREAVWKKLGCKKVGGRWVTEDQLTAEKAEAEVQKAADKKWKPLLTKYRSTLNGRDASRREKALEALDAISDPRAVPAVWSILYASGSTTQETAVRVLGQIDSAASSRALAFASVFNDSAEVRRAATEILSRRDPREFAGLLVALLRDQINYEIKPVGGPGSPGALFIAGKKLNVQRVYAPPGMPTFAPGFQNALTYDNDGLPVVSTSGLGFSRDVITARVNSAAASRLVQAEATEQYYVSSPSQFLRLLAGAPPLPGLNYLENQASAEVAALTAHANVLNAEIRQQTPRSLDHRVNVHRDVTNTPVLNIPIGRMMLETQRAALSAQQQLESDAAAIDEMNTRTQSCNDRVSVALSAISGRDLGTSVAAWKQWWFSQLGYQAPKDQTDSNVPTVVENVPLNDVPTTSATTSMAQTTSSVTVFRAMSCFGAGTQVRTFQGTRSIEQLKIGDRVLTSNIKTGSLGYQPVTLVHHNPPSPTFLIKIKGDTIVSSPFHRFWVVGKGWIMARDMKGGETLRLLDGPAVVESVEDGPVQPVFNLDIADDHDFFAGAAAALVHDNTLPDTRLTPFDAAPVLAGVSR